MIKAIINFFKPKTLRDYEHEYYCQATDMVDLERRMRVVQRETPFRVY